MPVNGYYQTFFFLFWRPASPVSILLAPFVIEPEQNTANNSSAFQFRPFFLFRLLLAGIDVSSQIELPYAQVQKKKINTG